MRRLMKLVVERSVNKVVSAIDEGAVVQRIMERIDSVGIAEKVSQMLNMEDVHADVLNEVAERIDKYTVMEHVADRIKTEEIIDHLDKDVLIDNITENVGQYIDLSDVAYHIDDYELAQHIDYETLSECIDMDDIMAGMKEACLADLMDGESRFATELDQHVENLVTKHVAYPVGDQLETPVVGKVAMVDRVIEAAAMKLLEICERTLESGDEAEGEDTNIQESTNGTVSSVSVSAP
jgi:hypothetical protein